MDSISVIFDPKIELAELSIQDVEFGSNPNYKPKGGETKFSKLVGDYSPFVEINGMKFSGYDIENFVLDLSGFVPRVTIAIKEKSGLFASKSYPKDGDLIQVYIKSNNKDFKPVRQDFRVLDCDAGPSVDDKGEINTFIVEGIINLPDMWVDKAKSYPGKTSLDTITDICKDLKLGLAVNETSPSDAMTRICPYTTYEDFILNDIIPSTYKDDNSFFTAFLDHHYYMNYIEVNSLITHDREFDQATINFLAHSDYNPDDNPEVEKELTEMYLSNSKQVYGTPNQITGYAPINDSGNISLKNGYRTYIQYYDKDAKDTQQYFIETLNTEGVENKIILKGRIDEDHTKQVKTVNLGYQFNDNVHENYHHARVQNKYNNEELNKLMMVVDLATINPNIHRYQILPIYIINNRGSDVRERATAAEEDSPNAIDAFLSGYYVVMGIKYVFSGSGGNKRFYQQMLMARREYDVPL